MQKGREENSLSSPDIFAATTTSVVSSLLLFLVAGLAVQMRKSLHFDVSSFGVVVSLYYLSAALGSVPMSRLAESVGALRAMRFGCVVMGMLLLLLATVVHSFVGLAVVMAIAGAVSSGLQPAINLFLVRRVPSRYHGRAFGIKQAAVPMAVFLGGLSVPVVALTIGWRWAFVCGAAIALGASIAMPRSRRSFSAYRANRPSVVRLGSEGVGKLMVLAFGFALGVGSASALSAFAVSAAVAAGQSEGHAGLLASLGGLAAAVTRVLMGIYADRSGSAGLGTVGVMLAVGAVAYVSLALSFVTTASLVFVVGAVLAFSAGWGWNGLFSLTIVRNYPSQAARATGITAVGSRMGGVIGPLVFGATASHLSYATAWLLTAAAAGGAAVVMLQGRKFL